MTKKEKISASKFISLALRHQPQKIGIALDENGWADTDGLLNGLNRAGHPISLEDLKEIVATSDKQRFKFNHDDTKIRANQGHSVVVDLELEEAVPPDVLYHGTAARFMTAIQKEGLTAQSRLHVHLSGDAKTAGIVGKRHGTPVILTVASGRMQRDGFRFFLSDNNVWLTEKVPVAYISENP